MEIIKMMNETVKIKVQTENNDSESNTDFSEITWEIEEPDLTPKTTEWFWRWEFWRSRLLFFLFY